jgi:hypothetical protein
MTPAATQVAVSSNERPNGCIVASSIASSSGLVRAWSFFPDPTVGRFVG